MTSAEPLRFMASRKASRASGLSRLLPLEVIVICTALERGVDTLLSTGDDAVKAFGFRDRNERCWPSKEAPTRYNGYVALIMRTLGVKDIVGRLWEDCGKIVGEWVED